MTRRRGLRRAFDIELQSASLAPRSRTGQPLDTSIGRRCSRTKNLSPVRLACLISVSVTEASARMFSSRPVTERDRAERLRRNVIASRIAGDRMMVAFERLRTLVLREKFNPDQPRVPAGNPDGGQWTGGSSESTGASDLPSSDAIAGMSSRALRAACEAQFDRDIFQCRMVGLRSCDDQAYQRYAACLARQQIPPFNY